MQRTRLTEEVEVEPVTPSFEFKAMALRREIAEASIAFEVKGVRAVFDPDMADGNGGWRCPPGTRYAGRWSDQFGRNCGGGALRRIGNALGGIGGKLNNEPGPNDSRKPNRPSVDNTRVRKLEERARQQESRARKLEAGEPKTPRRERRARRLDEAARVQQERANRLNPQQRPETPEPAREATPEKPAPRPVINLAGNRRVNARRENERSRPKPNERPKPVQRRPRVAGQPRRREDVIEVRNQMAEERFGFDFGNFDSVKAISDPDLLRWQKELRNEVAEIRKEPNRVLQDRPALQAKTDILSVFNTEVARRSMEADMRYRAEQAAKLDAERNERNRIANEVEAKRVADLGPFVPGIMNVRGAPEFGDLRVEMFTPSERVKIETPDRDILLSGQDVRNDSWDDEQALRDYSIDLTQQRQTIFEEQDAIISDLRMNYVRNPHQVRDEQIRYMQLAAKIDQIDEELVASRSRRLVLNYRRVADENLVNARNSDLDVRERQKSLDSAREAVYEISSNGTVWPADATRDQAKWLSDFNSESEALEADIVREEALIYGPRGRDEIIRMGGTSVLNRQNNLDSLIRAVNDSDLENRAEAVAALRDFRKDLRAEMRQLGPEEGVPEALERNNLRNYLKMADVESGKVISEAQIGLEKRLPMYESASPAKPEVMGELYDGFGGKAIMNPDIKTESDAIKFIADGGSLDEVPNMFWWKAVEKNASSSSVDKTKRFKIIPKNGGDIGETHIYVARGPDGKGTSKGHVFKADKDVAGMGEVLSQQLMIEHGLPVNGAGWDGMSEKGYGKFVVLPFAWNGVESPEKAGYEKRNYHADLFVDNGLEKEGVAVRLHSLIHNFMLGVDDRHGNNSFTGIVNGKPVVIPIDQGWAGKDTNEKLTDYFSNYRMDRTMFDDAQRLLSKEQDEKYAQAVIDMYDAMIERTELIGSESLEQWMERVKTPGIKLSPAEMEKRVRVLRDSYLRRAESLVTQRKRNLAKWMSKPIFDKLVK